MNTQSILQPDRLFCRRECLGRESWVPPVPGIYGWYFDRIPKGVPTLDAHAVGEWTLLYIGISPKEPSTLKPARTKQGLRSRIATHFGGNAEGSTLRKTLGILLAEELGFPLRRVGSGRRMTFTHLGEQALDAWMDRHARVCWAEDPEPWVAEANFIQTLSLPLNLKGNGHHPFFDILTSRRSSADAAAREQPIASEFGRQRRGPAHVLPGD